MKGKLIIIEGTDCSGKETQAKLLFKKLTQLHYKTVELFFPRYDTATGRIIAGPYLGKEGYEEGCFKETSAKVDPLVSSLYFAADRKYNCDEIINYLDAGYIVIIDRYVSSNMAHQGGKIYDKKLRQDLYQKISKLEYEILELPQPDWTAFLYMPYENALELRKNRKELPDQNERNEKHLKNAEEAYIEMADLFNFETINCLSNKKIRSIEDINQELCEKVLKFINNK